MQTDVTLTKLMLLVVEKNRDLEEGCTESWSADIYLQKHDTDTDRDGGGWVSLRKQGQNSKGR